MARLGVPPHVADRVLKHRSGTISGVAAVYNRFEYIAERRAALEQWGGFVQALVQSTAMGKVATPAARLRARV
jgi:hypothetical protein